MPLARNAIVAPPSRSSRSNSPCSFSARPDSLSPHVRSVRDLMTDVMPARRSRSGSTVPRRPSPASRRARRAPRRRPCRPTRVADRADEARCRAGHLRDDRRALAARRPAGGCSRASGGRGHRRSVRMRSTIASSRSSGHAHDVGDDVARDVVLRRAEPAADDHRVAALDRLRDDRFDAVPVVADLRLEVGVDAHERELLTDPRRVGVDDLPEQQLGTDRDDFAPHADLPPVSSSMRLLPVDARTGSPLNNVNADGDPQHDDVERVGVLERRHHREQQRDALHQRLVLRGPARRDGERRGAPNTCATR